MGKNGKIKIITLGCPKNVVDSEVIMKEVDNNNFILAGSDEESDIAVINTCGFIDDAKRESIDTILQAVKLKKEGRLKKIIAIGCLVERYRRELREEIPEVDAFIGVNKLSDVIGALGGELRDEIPLGRMLTTPGHYAYLKISEGCDRFCSFCTIPAIRGKHISKPIEQIVLEAENLAASGVKEIILIAQDSTYYGLDLFGKPALAELLERLSELHGVEWLRLMYAFPAGFPVDILRLFNSGSRLCSYLDLPVQHSSDTVLKSMCRGINSYGLRKLIDHIRDSVPGIALRSTLIVGYPTEGENEFRELERFVKEVEFDRLGVIPYSHEDGTGAFRLGDNVPEVVKEERKGIIMELQRGISMRQNRRFLNKTLRVLIDRKEGRLMIGRTERDAPEVDNEVIVSSFDHLDVGSFYDVEVTGAGPYDLYANAGRQGSQESRHIVFPGEAG